MYRSPFTILVILFGLLNIPPAPSAEPVISIGGSGTRAMKHFVSEFEKRNTGVLPDGRG